MRHRIVLWGWFIRRQGSDFEGGSESSDWTGVWDSCRTTFPSEGKCQRMENPQPQIQCLLDWWLIDYKCSTRFIKFTVGIGSQNWTYNEILYLSKTLRDSTIYCTYNNSLVWSIFNTNIVLSKRDLDNWQLRLLEFG